eukprot:CAMPEP_0117489550 /NCGR_PEP_ID=MMETSP0784-20121206/17092_1 /TAXON_ID=39447 /ORGANISM="" /LENGTH=111 /DNA_ID=CAMNT_0005284279 /DNA_START=32 /DNA_END=367 /DNA_ORIENTATION=-
MPLLPRKFSNHVIEETALGSGFVFKYVFSSDTDSATFCSSAASLASSAKMASTEQPSPRHVSMAEMHPESHSSVGTGGATPVPLASSKTPGLTFPLSNSARRIVAGGARVT